MTPKTKTENLIAWAASIVAALLVAFLSSLVLQASSIPEDQPISWRPIWISVASTAISLIPVVVAGLGLPTFGKEYISSLTSNLGKEEAIARLETPAVDSVTPVTPEELSIAVIPHINLDVLATKILEERDRRESLARQFPNGPLPTTINESIP